jgi:hypothetical protein
MEAQKRTESGHEHPRRRQRPPLALAHDEPGDIGRREVRDVERTGGKTLPKKAEDDGTIRSQAICRQPALTDNEPAVAIDQLVGGGLYRCGRWRHNPESTKVRQQRCNRALALPTLDRVKEALITLGIVSNVLGASLSQDAPDGTPKRFLGQLSDGCSSHCEVPVPIASAHC